MNNTKLEVTNQHRRLGAHALAWMIAFSAPSCVMEVSEVSDDGSEPVAVASAARRLLSPQ